MLANEYHRRESEIVEYIYFISVDCSVCVHISNLLIGHWLFVVGDWLLVVGYMYH